MRSKRNAVVGCCAGRGDRGLSCTRPRQASERRGAGHRIGRGGGCRITRAGLGKRCSPASQSGSREANYLAKQTSQHRCCRRVRVGPHCGRRHYGPGFGSPASTWRRASPSARGAPHAGSGRARAVRVMPSCRGHSLAQGRPRRLGQPARWLVAGLSMRKAIRDLTRLARSHREGPWPGNPLHDQDWSVWRLLQSVGRGRLRGSEAARPDPPLSYRRGARTRAGLTEWHRGCPCPLSSPAQ